MQKEKLKVLLIEDDEDDRLIIKKLFEDSDFNRIKVDVLESKTLKSGINKLESEKVDIVLCDLGLPDSEGVNSAVEICNKAPDTPAIVLTGLKDENSATNALHHGVQDYLYKNNLNSELLYKSIYYAIERKSVALKVKKTHAQLLQAEKMASMGILASGIVHELTQPLLGITCFSSAMENDLKKIIAEEASTKAQIKEEITKRISDLHEISRQAQRMNSIISNIRDFARSDDTEKKEVSINSILDKSLKIFHTQLKTHSINLKVELENDLPNILGNNNQLEQVFINLISNAKDSLDSVNGEKELVIRTQFSDSVQVNIKDTGKGMDEKTKSSLFEPFFTTKEPGVGTGLGMSIVSKILNDHNAQVEVTSEPGNGAEFIINFPLIN